MPHTLFRQLTRVRVGDRLILSGCQRVRVVAETDYTITVVCDRWWWRALYAVQRIRVLVTSDAAVPVVVSAGGWWWSWALRAVRRWLFAGQR